MLLLSYALLTRVEYIYQDGLYNMTLWKFFEDNYN